MFKVKNFREYPSLIPYIEKLNRVLEKENYKKVSKLLQNLPDIFRGKKYIVPLSFIFSYIGEYALRPLPMNPNTMEIYRNKRMNRYGKE